MAQKVSVRPLVKPGVFPKVRLNSSLSYEGRSHGLMGFPHVPSVYGCRHLSPKPSNRRCVGLSLELFGSDQDSIQVE